MRSKVAVRRKLFRTLLDAYLELGDQLLVTEAVLSGYNENFKEEVAVLKQDLQARQADWMQDKTETLLWSLEHGDYEATRALLQGVLELFKRSPS